MHYNLCKNFQSDSLIRLSGCHSDHLKYLFGWKPWMRLRTQPNAHNATGRGEQCRAVTNGLHATRPRDNKFNASKDDVR